MKYTLRLIFSIIFISSFEVSFAQQQMNIGCIDKAVRLKEEELKQSLVKQGMIVFKDAMITMQSQTPFPVEVQLKKGTLYQFMFIAGMESTGAKMELFDGDDKKLAEKKIGKAEKPGYIIYPFIPDKTDTYLIILTQKQKNKTMCSSFTIMQQAPKDTVASAATVIKSNNPSTPNNTKQSKGSQTPNSNRYAPKTSPQNKR